MQSDTSSRDERRSAWAIVAVLAVTETVSWGILYYAFAVFLVPMQHEFGWSRTALTGAFSVALATSALAAFPVGHWLDRHGPRALMTLGSLTGAVLVLAWSQVNSLLTFYLIWTGIGVAMAAVLYEAAFTVLAKWFRRDLRRALTSLTLVGGLASFIFSPLSNWLISLQGWRAALVTLSVILALTTTPLHALFLRRPPPLPHFGPELPAGEVSSALEERPLALRSALSSSVFWYLTAAFVLSSFAISAIAVHLIPYLIAGGRSAAFAAAAAGLLGLMQIPGRLLFAAAGKVLPRRFEAPSVFLLQGAGIAILAATTSPSKVVVGVAVLGMANGMATLVRATAIAEAYGSSRYGSLAGIAAGCATASRAVAPVVTAAVQFAFGSYQQILWALVVMSAFAAASVHVANVRQAALTIKRPAI
jgi:MFS family permease